MDLPGMLAELALLMSVLWFNLSVQCPSGCVCLSATVVDCSNSSFDGNTTHLWNSHYLKVEELNLAGNNYDELPVQLAEFGRVTLLNLSGNKVKEIPHHVIIKMRKLKLLDLSRNSVDSFALVNSETVFNLYLETLNVSFNPLVNLGNGGGEDLYSGGSSVRTLDVSHCQIAYVTGNCLQEMKYLTHLNISHNPISRLDGLQSKSLISLDASNCNIQFLRSETLEELPHLKELYISQNVHLNNQMFKSKSKSIEIFDASYCSVDARAVSEFPNVFKVSLKGNRIKDVPSNCFRNNHHLEWLDMSENYVKFISEFAFAGASSLRFLDLSRNLLTHLDEYTFSYVPNLSTLNLSRNFFKILTPLKAASVTSLDLSHCEISVLYESCLAYLQSLQKLNLAYNLLEHLPVEFSSTSLQDLDLSFCRILNLNASHVYGIPSLNTLDLTGNRLVYLPNDTFMANRHLKSLTMGNNPWICNCLNENFRTLWCNVRNVTVDVAGLMCNSPQNVSGMLWTEACAEVWNIPPKRRDWFMVWTLVVLLALCTGFACVMGYRENQRLALPRREESRTAVRRNSIDHEEQDQRISESLQKLSQLPSYDEALLLPKFCQDDSISRKRQSGTQTEETMTSLLAETQCSGSRNSMNEIQYINLPTPVQSTEL